MFGFKEDFMYNVACFEENMTVSQLHAVLEKNNRIRKRRL